MDLFLDDRTSLQLMRTLMRDPSAMLKPSDMTLPMPMDVSTAKLHRLGISQLLVRLRIPERNQLGLLVPSRRDRVEVRGIECHVLSRPRGEHPFLQLASTDERNPSLLIPPATRVYTLSPPQVVLGMARRLRQQELAHQMTHQRALLMLVKLCLELCGTYSHDPLNPWMGPVVYNASPWTSAHDLRQFATLPGKEQGLALLREAVSLVYDRSGSPQESCMGPALFFDCALGGLTLGEFCANKPLDLSPAQMQAIDYRTITPDFQLLDYNSVIEYIGSIHELGDNPRIDHVRTLDYETLGVREFAFTYHDVCTSESFMHSAKRIVTAMAQVDGPDVSRRFQRLCSSQEFRERQQTLFEVFRPWLR